MDSHLAQVEQQTAPPRWRKALSCVVGFVRSCIAACVVAWVIVYTFSEWSHITSKWHWSIATLLAVGAAAIAWHYIKHPVRLTWAIILPRPSLANAGIIVVAGSFFFAWPAEINRPTSRGFDSEAIQDVVTAELVNDEITKWKLGQLGKEQLERQRRQDAKEALAKSMGFSLEIYFRQNLPNTCAGCGGGPPRNIDIWTGREIKPNAHKPRQQKSRPPHFPMFFPFYSPATE